MFADSLLGFGLKQHEEWYFGAKVLGALFEELLFELGREHPDEVPPLGHLEGPLYLRRVDYVLPDGVVQVLIDFSCCSQPPKH